MANMTLTEKREYINSLAFTELRKARKGYVCPICGNGSGSDGTGIEPSKQTGLFTCWKGCFKGKDYLDILKIKHGTTNEQDIFRTYGLNGDNAPYSPVNGSGSNVRHSDGNYTPENKNATEGVTMDFTEYYERAHKTLIAGGAGFTYLERRGITRESMERFNLGFDPNWKNPAIENAPTSPRVIVPRSNTSYLARCIDEKNRYGKMIAGNVVLFHADRLQDAGKYGVVFVVEGEFDAIAIEQQGFAAIGLGSTSNIDLFFHAVQKNRPSGAFILALDNDDAGKKAQQTLSERLESLHIPFYTADVCELYGEHKDAAESVRADKDGFIMRLGDSYGEFLQYQQAQSIQEQSQQEEREERTPAGFIDQFLKTVQTHRYEPISTEIPELDKKLCGGLLRQSLVMIGAAPGAGKTAFAQQVFEGIAKSGRKVLFINLEMSREQLIARSLSRIAFGMKKKIAATEVLRGYDWTAEQRQTVTEAAGVFRDISDRIVYNPDDVTTDVDKILEYLAKEAADAERAGEDAPFVVLDYLQLLTGNAREDVKDTIKRAVFGLKKYAIDHDSIVFCVLATNRESNRAGTVTLESGRDTSAIEYSADLFLGLSLTAVENAKPKDKEQAAENAMQQEVRQVTLKVLKSRMSPVGANLNMNFHAAYSTFHIAAQGYRDEAEAIPEF